MVPHLTVPSGKRMRHFIFSLFQSEEQNSIVQLFPLIRPLKSYQLIHRKWLNLDGSNTGTDVSVQIDV